MEYYKKLYGYKINLDDERYILIDAFKDEENIRNDVYYNDKLYETFLGSYYSYNPINGINEWIEYNSDFIVLMYTKGNNNYDVHIKYLYDTQKGIFVTGTEEEIFDYYENNFKHKKLIKKHS